MSDAPNLRNGFAIMDEFCALTNRMVEQRHDENFLIEGSEKRQMLMDEYVRWASANPADRAVCEKDPQTRRIIAKILPMDKVISKALAGFKAAAQSDVASSNAQQKVLGYLGSAISSSGSYMDYKK